MSRGLSWVSRAINSFDLMGYAVENCWINGALCTKSWEVELNCHYSKGKFASPRPFRNIRRWSLRWKLLTRGPTFTRTMITTFTSWSKRFHIECTVIVKIKKVQRVAGRGRSQLLRVCRLFGSCSDSKGYSRITSNDKPLLTKIITISIGLSK